MSPRGSLESQVDVSRLQSGCELIVGAMACLAPWAFGSVDAWAEFGLGIGVAVLAIFSAINAWRSNGSLRLLNTPALAIAGLALLAWFQTVPLPAGVYKWIDPSGIALREGLVPATPQGVRGDDDPPVAPPALTLSQNPDATVRPAVQLTTAFILFECVVSLGGGYRALRIFGLAVTVNACALALFALVQALTWKGKIYGIRPSPIPQAWYSGGPFVSYHHLAAYLNFGLGFALAFAMGGALAASSRLGPRVLHQWGQRGSPLALYATGLIMVGVIGSHSRGGFLAMAISGAVLALVLRRQPLRVWITMAVALLFAALLLLAIGSTSPLERLSTIWETTLTGFNGRSQIWIASLRAWLANPIWGVGLGCFPEGAAPFYQFERESLYFHAENDYLEVLAEGGLLGFALGLLAFASIARLGSRAYRSAPTVADRAIVMGGLFGLVALAVKSCADFPLHIPGVAVTGLVLCAYLSRLGLDASEPVPASDAPWRSAPKLKACLVLFALAVLSVPLLWVGFRQTQTEIALVRAGIPLPGTQWLTADYGRLPIGELEEIEVTLEKILRDRPNWSEGHLRLGMMYVSQYEQTTAEWAEGAGQSPADALTIANPLWLHGLIHSEANSDVGIDKLIEEDPIWLYLVPAARSFLEARRCCPVRSLPHAWLASLDYLVKSGETTSIHVRRALGQSGNDTRVMTLGARAAVQVGDLELAARCWRKALELNPSRAQEIARAAGAAMSPRQILDQVLPANPTLLIGFADVLYSDPKSTLARNQFLEEAIRQAGRDPRQTPTERLWCEGQARARLDDRELARKQMDAALALEPARAAWRDEFVHWLIRWGDPEEAFNQATIGVHLAPGQSGPRTALDRATEARMRKRLETKTQP
jgi:O-antigen ligase/tetratricopeptide (TPR) repeat protein